MTAGGFLVSDPNNHQMWRQVRMWTPANAEVVAGHPMVERDLGGPSASGIHLVRARGDRG
jgi:hypothetical protein